MSGAVRDAAHAGCGVLKVPSTIACESPGKETRRHGKNDAAFRRSGRASLLGEDHQQRAPVDLRRGAAVRDLPEPEHAVVNRERLRTLERGRDLVLGPERMDDVEDQAESDSEILGERNGATGRHELTNLLLREARSD